MHGRVGGWVGGVEVRALHGFPFSLSNLLEVLAPALCLDVLLTQLRHLRHLGSPVEDRLITISAGLITTNGVSCDEQDERITAHRVLVVRIHHRSRGAHRRCL